ncbi:serine/threonine-protein kinase pelle [Epargyreus clarus]|uniref:serine/threonine-protein kinase pelle n=1 Tax=Epargyreus clarus TaxID=520877 RepID=UPI003C2CAFDD
MYIYELPYDINKELCRLLDNDDDWKELAGVHMKYSPFDVNEIEQVARRQSESPTNQLFVRWGQLNHRVEELFILFHRMNHIPALRCLAPMVDSRFHRLLNKQDNNNGVKERSHDNHDITQQKVKVQKVVTVSSSSLPLAVKLMEKGIPLATSSRANNFKTTDTNGDSTRNSTTDDSRSDGMNKELLQHASAIPMLRYEDLKEATNNWSESNLLGKGGFGQVFKGEWKLLPVAVKKLLRDNDGKNRELIREMCLNQYRHDNILPLYGYSLGGPEACLVYQLMAGGSLEQRLRGRTGHPPLTWSQRYNIAHGVARGLQFLHTMQGTPLIHGDIKPANILLDQCTMPKIGDFGLARKGPYGEERTHLKVSKVHGTRPYLPNEYITSGLLSPAVDVFSYGVVMIEMATALLALDRNRQTLLLSDYIHQLAGKGIDFASLEDPALDSSARNPALCRMFVHIGVECTARARHERPPLLHVYRRLDAMPR